MKRIAVLLAILGAFGSACANDFNADGKNFGKGQLNKIKTSVSDKNAKEVPHYTDNPPQKASYGASSLLNVGTGRITSCKTASPTGDAIADQECEAVNFLAGNPRAHFDLTPNDPAIIAGRVIAGDAANLAEQITGGANCVEKTTTTPAEKSVETCAEYLPVEDKQCTMGWKVDVNADSNFQCEQTYKALETQKCSKRLQVTCAPMADGCDNGGIVPGSTQGDMKVAFGPVGNGTYALDFGTIGNDYWPGNGTVYDRSLSYTIADVAKVTQFRLVQATFDDWIRVIVNGHLVYVGPYGGDRLEVFQDCWENPEGGSGGFCIPMVRYGPASNQVGMAELKTSWVQTLDIDLKPYLVNGTNVIQTRVVVAGNGEGAIRINARMMCPASCTDTIVNECSTLEARAK